MSLGLHSNLLSSPAALTPHSLNFSLFICFCFLSIKFQKKKNEPGFLRNWGLLGYFLLRWKLYSNQISRPTNQQFCGQIHVGKLCFFYPSRRNLPYTLKALRFSASSQVCLTLYNPAFSRLISPEPLHSPCGQDELRRSCVQDGVTSLCPGSTPRWSLSLAVKSLLFKAGRNQ